MCYIYARGYLCVLTQANSLGIFFRNGVLMMKKLLVTCFLFITMLSYSANIKLERIGIINLKKVVEVCFQGKSPAVKQLMEEKDSMDYINDVDYRIYKNYEEFINENSKGQFVYFSRYGMKTFDKCVFEKDRILYIIRGDLKVIMNLSNNDYFINEESVVFGEKSSTLKPNKGVIIKA